MIKDDLEKIITADHRNDDDCWRLFCEEFLCSDSFADDDVNVAWWWFKVGYYQERNDDKEIIVPEHVKNIFREALERDSKTEGNNEVCGVCDLLSDVECLHSNIEKGKNEYELDRCADCMQTIFCAR